MHSRKQNNSRGGKSGRCTGDGGSLDVGLPVMAEGSERKIKRSKNSRRRAAVLIGVHLLIAGHVVHYLLTGRTLSPVEPSEAMYTLEQGLVNAGAIFFAMALLSTLLVGRFVCGWGCHIVAYQDLCGWVMTKLGVKPKPFRSRFLVFAPLVVALYMFVWPAFQRAVFPSPERAFPGFSNHLMTTEFWKTFPGPVFAILTIFVCGLAAVYFLGAKGFCTYGCPYGGFFGLMDKVSVGGIIVNDDCEQCGHCTATCTSNVRVHEEIKLYGMVVDPGCMKTLDCVSVCPNSALRFGLARPSLLKGKPSAKPPAKRYDFTFAEELLAVLIFIGSTLAFRGLYDGPPLLLSVGMGGITAYIELKLLRLFRDPTVRIQNLKMKTAGKLSRAGWAFIPFASLWMLFTLHSGFVQWHRALGQYHLEQTEAGNEVFAADPSETRTYSDAHHAAAAESYRHFLFADRWGLAGVVQVKLGLTWHFLLENDAAEAERCVREAIALAPDQAQLHEHLTGILLKQRRNAEAIDAAQEAMTLKTPGPADHFRLAEMLVMDNRVDQAIQQFLTCIKLAPDSQPAHYNLGGLYRRSGQLLDAITHLGRATKLAPDDADTWIELGLAYVGAGDVDQAAESFRRATALRPDDPAPRSYLDAVQPRETQDNAL